MPSEELPDRLGPDEVARVLRRAAELDLAAGGPTDEGLPVASLEAAAAEVGLPAAAVRQAVAELRAGMLDEPRRPPRGLIVEAGVVPHTPEQAVAMVGSWLESQAFTYHRLRDGAHVWRPRQDLVGKLQRAFDWFSPVRIKEVEEVAVRAVAVEEGTLVRLEARLPGSLVAAPGIGAGVGGAVGGGAGLAGGLLTSASTPSMVAAGAVLAGAGAAGGWWVGVRHRRSRAHRVADELAADLERVGRGTAPGPGVLDRLRRHLGPGGRSGAHRHT